MSIYLPSFRQTLRRLTVERSFTLAIVLILAIGIAPAAAMLIVFYDVLLRPLDYHEPERLATSSGCSARVRLLTDASAASSRKA